MEYKFSSKRKPRNRALCEINHPLSGPVSAISRKLSRLTGYQKTGEGKLREEGPRRGLIDSFSTGEGQGLVKPWRGGSGYGLGEGRCAFTNGRGYSGICIGLQFVGNASKSFPLCFQLCKYFFAGKIRDLLGRRSVGWIVASPSSSLSSNNVSRGKGGEEERES